MMWARLLQLMPQISDTAEQLQVKAWWRSKTIWTNVITTMAAVAVVIGGARFDVSPDVAGAVAGGIVAVVNIVLRVLTDRPIGLRNVSRATGSGSDSSESHRDNIGI